MGKSKIECKKLEVLKGDQKCVFCHQTNIDEIKYGPIYMHKNIITHYYCLLLSSNMEQNGRDCDGILGFLPSDITKEVRRGVRLFCTFCKSGGATLGCAIAKCKVVFHLPCGMKHGTLHQFFGEFKSYCAKHRPVQRIGAKILAEASKNAMCGICYEKVVPRPIHETLWAPCCQKSAFFHRDCVQKLATSAGYFFKCPLCNNTSAFQKEMKEYGIYIPEQDASWESVPNAYQDLLVRHDTCDCATCSCPTGRKTNNQGTRWELILCKFCGSQGIHIGCGRLKWKSPEFVCDTCSGNNEREEEANTRNYHGNRHRLTGPGRTAEIHPSVSADRERERSDDNSSDESQKVTLSNRRGRRRVISPPRVSTPPPDTNINMKSEKHGKRSAQTSSIKVDDSPVLDDVTVVIDDSDDDVEVVSETKGSCLKTNDGSTIPIIQVRDNVKKRLNVEGDVNIVPEEIVDITIQMDGPPLKKAPSPHVEEVIYSFPSLTPKPSTSTSYCTPSTSFTAPPDVTKFVLVDPSTFRPEDLPPGTVLYRSFTPMVPMPPTMQPQVQPTPAGQVPMPQLGRAGGRGADAKHPNLGEHRGRSSFHLHAPTRHTKKTSRSNKHNSFGRRGRGRCDHDRLNPRVLVSPLKYRISNDGFFEILLPRRNLGFGFGHGSFKRKASPLPSRPAKKIKVSSKDSTVTKNKKSLKNGKPGKLNHSTNTKEKISKSIATRKYEKKNTKCSQDNQIIQKDSEEITHNSGNTQIPTFFSSQKKSDRKKSKKILTSAKRDCGAGKENASPELNVKKKRREIVLMEWKYKRIDEYLSKVKSEPIMPMSNDHEKTNSSNAEEESSQIVVSLLDELIGFVVEKYLYEKPPTAGSDTDKDASSLDIMNETNFSVQSNSSNSESANKQISTSSDANPGSSPDICKTTNKFTGNNSLMMTESVDMFEEEQVCEVNHKYITHKLVFPVLEVTSDFKNVGKTVDKSSNLVMNTKTESEVFVSHQIGISDRDVSCETSNNEDTSPATNNIDRTQDILKDCTSSIKPSVSAKDLSHHEYSVGSLTDEISPSHIEGFVSPGQSLSWSINRVGEVNMKTNDNKLQITGSLCKKTNSVTTHGLFPKIKIKASKVKSYANIKNNVLKSGQCVKSKVKTKAESKVNINDLKIPITKKGKIENVTLKGKGESNTEAMEQSKTKANVKEMRPPKTKRKKVEKHSPICKIGAIDKYFSPITRDYFSSPNKTFGDMTNGNKNSGKGKEQDSIPPPPAKLENNRFWKTLNAQNSPEKEKKINFPSPTVQLENGILRRYLNNQSSPQKIPLMELKFNNTETPNAVKAIQFDDY